MEKLYRIKRRDVRIGVALVGEGPHNAWFFVFAAGRLIPAWAVLGSGMIVGLLLKRLN